MNAPINATSGQPVDFYRPADDEDLAKLNQSRATLWPTMWLCVIVVVALVAACIVAFTWQPVVIALVIIAVCVAAILIGYGSAHAMSKEEAKEAETSLPGHDIFPPEDVRITAGKAYDFDCAPADLYPYLKQFNLIKAGYYSFDVLERFFGFHIVNDYTLRPEWQHIEPGDWIYYHQNGAGTGIVDCKENEYITTYSDTRYKPTQDFAIAWRPKWISRFAWTWNFIFQPTNNGEGTHLISYSQCWWPEDTSALIIARFMVEWGIPSNFMMNGMAHKLKKLSEADARARRAGKPRPGYKYLK